MDAVLTVERAAGADSFLRGSRGALKCIFLVIRIVNISESRH